MNEVIRSPKKAFLDEKMDSWHERASFRNGLQLCGDGLRIYVNYDFRNGEKLMLELWSLYTKINYFSVPLVFGPSFRASEYLEGSLVDVRSFFKKDWPTDLIGTFITRLLMQEGRLVIGKCPGGSEIYFHLHWRNRVARKKFLQENLKGLLAVRPKKK